MRRIEFDEMPPILDGWESPLEVKMKEIRHKVDESIENMTMQAIMDVGIEVNREELIKAMQYDRDQYSKGYKNGYNAGYYANKWVSTEENMPFDENEWVLVYSANIGIKIAKVSELNRMIFTHWMYLPEPPQIESEECEDETNRDT